VVGPSLAAIDAEIARRANRPKSPAAFALFASRGQWHQAKHLALLDQKLCDLAARKIRRLIVTMPPRHGKSQLCSRYFPAWYLGTHPNERVILCSYEANFAAEWGGRARDVLDEHGSLFGVNVRNDSSARDDWKIESREGGMVTAGVGGPITGRGANLLIIDDPVKNAAEAGSPTYRQRVWEWWTSTALTRVEPDGIVLLIMTRWNEDDLAGRLLRQNEDGEDDDEQWEVLNLPAIAEDDDALGRSPGEALWEERWPKPKLISRMKRLGSYVWNALFQQRPAPEEGNVFKRAWFPESRRVTEAPRSARGVRYWDLAATKQEPGTDPDWAVGCLMRTNGDRFWICDVDRFRGTPNEVEARVMQKAVEDGPDISVRVEQEPGAAAKLYIDSLARRMKRYDLKGIKSSADKVTRARPFAAACEREDVVLVRGAWNEAFIEELCKFPNGAKDDQVDAASGAHAELTEVGEPWTDNDAGEVLDYGSAT
jgi:predicted phage terminase large subunit-like protein